ncbi:N-formylglutamate amidohydrolase [Nocardioides sp. JQ2195]|uniref:N-formylglutamate amidohydrolase n=1 Tax=Nocardioides sp. JQ2195 TaxID=2592334 RepID=UPI00143E28BD|nr:N-formylglutamate amidohydrolase [Nocardioides sp. JQ2195]QIX27231.1 N-formylglutamate amidohydrolase [Nocardioides sp. JQ2195]
MPEQPASFEIIPGDDASSVVLHVPHSSTHLPDDVRRGLRLNDSALAAELHAITDADTDVVADGAAMRAAVRPWIFVNRASRLVVDPERFPDDREEMNSVGMGAVYEKTTQLETLRTPTEEERRQLIERFYVPYSQAFAALVRRRLAAVGRVTIVDVHSFPVDALPYELHGDGARPEVCIGTDEFHTSAELSSAAVEAMRAAAPTGDVGLDSPFNGCYVPLEQHGKNPRVQAVMLEMRRDVVRDDAGGLSLAMATLVDVIDATLP